MFGFNPIWFIGVVEDRTDPLKTGRCKVRCLGFHQQSSTELPTEELPWAQLLIPANSQNEIKPPKEGSWVMGFFKDGDRCQEPMITVNWQIWSKKTLEFSKQNKKKISNNRKKNINIETKRIF